jgi:chromosome partitioning protein
MLNLQVIAVSNRKGGTGKTTVSVNLAAELAARGRRVLLVDLDTQGHCTVGLGLELDRHEKTVHQLFTDSDALLSKIIKETSFPNLFIAPADQRFDHGSGIHDAHRLSRALAEEEIAQRFDVVILDTPPSLDNLLLNALTAANWLLVPYVPHHLSFEGVRQLMRVIFRVKSGGNPNLKILGFLPTAAAENIKLHRAVTNEVGRQFGAIRVLSGIRSDIKLAESFMFGKPIRHYAPNSRGAEDFGDLTDHLSKSLFQD